MAEGRGGGDAERMEWRGWKGRDGRKDEEGERRNAGCNGGGAEVGGESIGSGGVGVGGEGWRKWPGRENLKKGIHF